MLPWVSHRISLRFPVISHRTPTKITRFPIPRCLASGCHANDATLAAWPPHSQCLRGRLGSSTCGMEPPGETKANVRKPNGETMGNHGRPYENDLHCKWWVFHISWCGYRKVLNFVGFFLLLETKVSTIQCRGSQSFTSRPSPGWWSKSCSKRGGASQQLKPRNDGWTWPRKKRPSAESKSEYAVLGKMALKFP